MNIQYPMAVMHVLCVCVGGGGGIRQNRNRPRIEISWVPYIPTDPKLRYGYKL